MPIRDINGNVIQRGGIIIEPMQYDIGNGLKYDGTNDYVTVSDVPFRLSNGTFCCFAKKTTISNTNIYYPLVVKQHRTGLFILNGNLLTYDFNAGANRNTNFNVINNNVNFFVITFENLDSASPSNNAKIYYNGNLLLTTTQKQFGPNNNLEIGGGGGGNGGTANQYFDGIIYDTKIFDKALTQAEIDNLYNFKGNIIPSTAQANLVANYSFNQKSGTTLIDSSGNSNNGTLTNFANTTASAGNAWVDSNGNPITV